MSLYEIFYNNILPLFSNVSSLDSNTINFINTIFALVGTYLVVQVILIIPFKWFKKLVHTK